MSTQKKNYTPVYKKSPQKGKKTGRSGEALMLFRKRFITLGAIAFALALVLTLSLVFALYEPPYYEEISNKAEETAVSNGKILNGDFQVTLNSSGASRYPYLAQNWTSHKRTPDETVGGVISLADDRKSRVTADLKSLGVPQSVIDNTVFNDAEDEKLVDLTEDEYTGDDDYLENVMMLYNSQLSYQRAVSSSFTMSMGEYKHVRVWIKTDASAKAYIALRTSSSSTTSYEIKFDHGINTNNKWQAFDIYLEADPASSKTFYLDVGLGEESSKEAGMVLFGMADMTDLQRAVYNLMDKVEKGEFKNGTVPGRPETDLAGKPDLDELPLNKQIKSYDEKDEEAEDLYAAKKAFTTAEGDFSVKQIKDYADAEFPFYDDEQNVFELNNAAGGVKSKNFTLSGLEVTNKCYRVSFWIKTENIKYGQSAYVYMNAYRDGELDTEKSTYIGNIRTSEKDEENVHSGWSSCTFYIKPSNIEKCTLELVISIGKQIPLISDEAVTGTVYATEFEVFEITKAEIGDAGGGSQLKVIDLDRTTATGLITNGNFNTAVKNAEGDRLGLAPEGWQVIYYEKPGSAAGDREYYEDHTFGIVPNPKDGGGVYQYPQDYFLLKDSALSNAIFSLPGAANVFGVTATGKTVFTMRSNSFSIPAKSTYLVSVLVNSNSLKDVNVSLKGDLDMTFNLDSYGNLYRSPVDYSFYNTAVGSEKWVKLNFLVTTGELSKSTYLEISLGTTDKLAEAGAYLVVDEARTNEISETNYDKFMDENYTVKAAGNKFEMGAAFSKNETGDELILESNFGNIKGKDFTKIDLPEEDEDSDTTDDTTDDGDDNKERFKWEYLGSIILGAAVIVFLFAMIIRRFKFFRKKEVTEYDEEYKR